MFKYLNGLLDKLTSQPVNDSASLRKWKTDVFSTVAGVALWLVLTTVSDFPFSLDILLRTAFSLLSVYYALVVFPTYFTAKPRLTNTKVVSFANGFFGGVIFGLLWNRNLTKKTQGISYIVFTVVLLIVFIIRLILKF